MVLRLISFRCLPALFALCLLMQPLLQDIHLELWQRMFPLCGDWWLLCCCINIFNFI
jgi:hypothetical protein